MLRRVRDRKLKSCKMADTHCPLEVNAVVADQDIKVGIVMHPGERIVWIGS
jgi:hypothetical protein